MSCYRSSLVSQDAKTSSVYILAASRLPQLYPKYKPAKPAAEGE